ncbi:MAG: deoxyribodipyrimidine photolyase [Bacteroidetes bacterium GWF2_33_16]|nr:MAG: deoxyribodipyrimidine photolyase [Bacteroidetes bacterium GWE2_32_14]OFY06691.1 MAG: deoxyribodipyrimidine photolyase [Bacteroidetes bacterium GWF2_33_16]
MKKVTVFWFRRDLRLFDNHAFFQALQKGNVLPIFIFDKIILQKLENKNDHRISFIYDELINLKAELELHESSLYVFHDNPLNAFKRLTQEFQIEALYFNQDYEPYAISRDKSIVQYLTVLNIPVYTYKDQVIYEKNEIVKPDGKPYTIFTPYMRKWKEEFKKIQIQHFASENLLRNLYKTSSFKLPSLSDIGFQKTNYIIPSKEINNEIIKNYDKNRDFPSINGTSKLSVHLRFGTISIRLLIESAKILNETYLNELIWREFYMMILYHFPSVENHSFKTVYDKVEWVNNESYFDAWCNGKTGYPIVDAGMHELNKTGFMHNRVRMITASFLTKHLLTDWRWGEAYFAQKLLDYELSSNNGGWQWAASTGCDAVPYFRIFNPDLQTKRFDPDYEYIRKWIPEFNTNDYPKPIIDHTFARERAIKTYKKVHQ